MFETEPDVFQVGVNGVEDAAELAGVSTPEADAVRFAVDGGRYVLADMATTDPVMFDTARLDRAGASRASIETLLRSSAGGQPMPGCGRRASTGCSASQRCRRRQ